MDLSLGTFNLNNLFSRFNYEAEVGDLPPEGATIERDTTFPVADPTAHHFRTYRGRLIFGKDPEARREIAERIKRMDLDVLAVQEVEDVVTLKNFAAEDLDGLYPYATLIEGNDPRLIDLGVVSKLPLGAVTSWQHAVHPADPSEPVFSRDLLQVEVLDPSRRRTLLTVFNNHLKSHYIAWRPDQDLVKDTRETNERRKRQADAIADIVASELRPDSHYAVVGDMNDPPDSEYLAPFAHSADLRLVDGLRDPEETRPAKADDPPRPSKAWTHRFKESGKPAHYALYDHIWLSPSLATRQTGAFIDRRTQHGGNGSDHDPAWVTLGTNHSEQKR